MVAAFAISWAIWLPLLRSTSLHEAGWVLYFGGVIGPAAAAFLCAGSRPVVTREVLVRRILRWRVQGRWYAIAILLPFAIHGSAVMTTLILDQHAWQPALRSSTAIIRTALLVLLLVPFEEIGWRGYALPLLESRYSPVASSIFVGFLWSLWHLPLAWAGIGYQQSEQPWSYMWRFFITILPISCLATWLFNRASESIPVVSLFHAAVDMADFAIVLPAQTGPRVVWLACAIGSAVVVVLFWLPQTRHRTPRSA